jgi:hypothetical protein
MPSGPQASLYLWSNSQWNRCLIICPKINNNCALLSYDAMGKYYSPKGKYCIHIQHRSVTSTPLTEAVYSSETFVPASKLQSVMTHEIRVWISSTMKTPNLNPPSFSALIFISFVRVFYLCYSRVSLGVNTRTSYRLPTVLIIYSFCSLQKGIAPSNISPCLSTGFYFTNQLDRPEGTASLISIKKSVSPSVCSLFISTLSHQFQTNFTWG